MRVFVGLSLFLLTVSAAPQFQDNPLSSDMNTDSQPARPKQQKQNGNKNTEAQQQQPHAKEGPGAKHNATQAPTVDQKGNSTSNSTAPPVHCSRLLASIASSGINQECAIHDDCMGACCQLELLAHKMAYNFSVKPCETPSVRVEFNITDIEGATINKEYTSSDVVTIPKGNMTYPGVFETESSLTIQLDKVLDITHFKLDFGVHYRVLKNDPLQSFFSHTLIPMLTLQFSKEICIIPTGDEDKYFGVIPKEYVQDKTKLALIGTIIALAVVVLIGLIYFVVAKKRAEGGFYRTYVSTDENRHLTKGNDGFEPLDDSDID